MNAEFKQHIIAETYRSPVVFALALQIPIAILCLLMLDGGLLARVCGVAMAGHWLGILLVMSRRPHKPTWMDLAYIRGAFLGLFVMCMFAQEILGR